MAILKYFSTVLSHKEASGESESKTHFSATTVHRDQGSVTQAWRPIGHCANVLRDPAQRNQFNAKSMDMEEYDFSYL